MGQKIFRKGLIEEFIRKVKSKDDKFIALYLNKEEFKYKFNEEYDFVESDLPKIPSDLGVQLEEIFKSVIEPSTSEYRKADFECAKHLYENLELTPRQASNLEFWNYLHHTICYKYIHLRWNRIESSDVENYISRHWLMNQSSQKHLINYPLTTLWWSVHLSIDSTKSNQYELTEVYFQNNRYRTVMPGGSSFVRHKEALLGILEFIKENNLQPTKILGDEISRFVNLLGGTKPLSFFDREWFKEQLERYFEVKNLEKKNNVLNERELNNDSYIVSTSGSIQIKNQETQDEGRNKILGYFNLNDNGIYKLSQEKESGFKYHKKILESHRKGYLLICYNEDGNINRVTVQSLLRRNREYYKNGLYKGSTLNKLLLTTNEAIIGIFYKQDGIKYFKAHLLSQFKDNNDKVGLQGYKTLYTNYERDSLDFIILPIDVKDDISKLVFQSLTASGKDITNLYYKKEFRIISQYAEEHFRRSNTLF